MKKIILIFVAFSLFLLVSTSNALALRGKDAPCDPTGLKVDERCEANFVCRATDPNNPAAGSSCQSGSIEVKNPPRGFTTLGNAITNALIIAFAIAVIIVLLMLIIGAYEWITSGGDKEAVAKARNRIINALIGLAVLAVAFALARVGAQFTGLDINNLFVPAPNPTAVGL